MVKLNQPYFSIIIPTFNRAHLIGESIKSIQNQTFQNWECIIVDDGSTDDTKNIVMEFVSNDIRFKYFFQENQERSVARNNGILKAIGQYICFLDSDDLYTNDRLYNFFDLINKKKHDVIFTDIVFQHGFKKEIIKYNKPNGNILDYLASNVIGIPQLCIRKEILLDNPFNPLLFIGEDLELWIRIADNYKFYYQKNNATIVAIHHENRSVNLEKSNSPKEQLKTLKIIFKKNHSGHKISKNIKKLKISNCYFNSAKHFMFKNQKLKAGILILKSILMDWKNSQTKHKIYCLKKLILGKTPNEYIRNE